MAQLEELLSRIEDGPLRSLLEDEVRQLKKRTDFGLVFERHLPESVLVGPTAGVRPGETVRLRRNPEDRRDLTVFEVAGDTAKLRDAGGNEERAAVADLLLVKEFDDPVYPTLKQVGSVSRAEQLRDPHLVIEGENFHALQLLRFTHRGAFDCIYIDPPYNTGARDWKYNNAFVDDNDGYRHSKWLSFMEKRLKLAKELLRPDGVLIITIDENELNHLGVLLERRDLFADALRQTVTICTNPSGAAGEGLSRVEEYAVLCFLGDARPVASADDMLTQEGTESESAVHGVSWERLMRRGNAWYRASRRNLCYPVLLNDDCTRIVRAGEPWFPPTGKDGDEDEDVRPTTVDGHPVAWPVRSDGKLGIWRVQPTRLNWLVERGYAYVSTRRAGRAPTLRYLLVLLAASPLGAGENGGCWWCRLPDAPLSMVPWSPRLVWCGGLPRIPGLLP